MASREQIAELRDRAAEALERGRLDVALKAFLELERADASPDWPRRAALVLHRLGRERDEIEALSRASKAYARQGETLKAVATSKQILALDPRHAETLRRLPELRAAWGVARATSLAPEPGEAACATWAKRPDSGLLALDLRAAVPTSRAAAKAGVHRIPLEDDATGDLDLQLADDLPNHLQAEAFGTKARLERDEERRVRAPSPGEDGPVRLALDPRGNVTTAATEDLLIASVEEEVRAAERANAALSKVTLFTDLPPKTFGELLLHARLLELPDKAELFRQGAVGDALYVVAEGEVGVVDEGPPRRGIARLGEGQIFGEIALVTDQPRTATIVALADCLLIAIDRSVVRRVIEADVGFLTALLRFLRDRLVDRLLLTNPLFTSLSARDRDALKPRFRFLEVEPGSVLIEAGERPGGLTILLAGDAEVVRADPARGEVLLGGLTGGDVFGETALLTNGVAYATVRAKTKCFALELGAAEFQKIVGARPEALAFVRRIMEERVAQSKAVLSGRARYAEGSVRVL